MPRIRTFKVTDEQPKSELSDDLDFERARFLAEQSEEVSMWCEQSQLGPEPPWYGWNMVEQSTEELATKIRATHEWEGDIS